METVFAIMLAMITFAQATARPQDVPGVTMDTTLEQALGNADTRHEHPFSGVEEGFGNFQGAEYGEGTGYGGQGSEYGGFLMPNAETNDPVSQISPEESHGFLEFLHPSTETYPWFPEEGTSSLLTHPEQQASGVPTIDSNNPSFNNATSFPFQWGNAATGSPANAGGNEAGNPQNLIGSLWNVLNNSQNGNATAGGAGIGSVQNGSAVGQGTGVANVGVGGFGIGLGIGGAIQTPLGNLAFGQGNGVVLG